jgi:hypothetical protein
VPASIDTENSSEEEVVADLFGQLTQQREKNQIIAKDLSKYGSLDSNGILLHRFQCLLEMVLDKPSQLLFELRFEKQMEDILTQSLEAAEKAEEEEQSKAVRNKLMSGNAAKAFSNPKPPAA